MKLKIFVLTIFFIANFYDVDAKKLPPYNFDSDTTEVKVYEIICEDPYVFIPNAFSPNGDGLNDTFIPKLRAVSSFQMEIFNTWGEKLYSTSSLESNGWDGTHKGLLAPAGNFLYRITYSTLDGQSVTRSGGITLIR